MGTSALEITDSATIRQALLDAADQIEREPKTYNYDSVEKPQCKTPACMWGWVGKFLGIKTDVGSGYLYAVSEAVGFDYVDVADYGDSLGLDARGNAPDAAKALRLFADRHFPAVQS